MIKKWDLIKSIVVYKDQWISLRNDRCVRQDGRIIEPYHVLEYGDWVNVVPVTPDLRVILVRQYRHGAGIISLEFAGGDTDQSDASPEDAARRELAEETGYGGGSFFNVGSSYANPANQTNRVHSFLAIDVEPMHTQKLDGNEKIEVVPLPFREVITGKYQSKEVGTLMPSLHLATLHLAFQYLLRTADPKLQQLRDMLLEAAKQVA